MSKVVSALNGVQSDGIAQITELGLAGMITIRGDFADAAFGAAVTAASGCEMPDQLAITAAGENRLAWMSPDELLWLCDHGDAQENSDALAAALADQHAMVTNVSDARALFEVAGKSARAVGAKIAPADMSPSAFPTGVIRRTRLAQIPGAVWMEDAETLRIICFRSVAQYAFDVLSVAAQSGSDPQLWD
jgi:sarcosine oxidase subunit gamma